MLCDIDKLHVATDDIPAAMLAVQKSTQKRASTWALLHSNPVGYFSHFAGPLYRPASASVGLVTLQTV